VTCGNCVFFLHSFPLALPYPFHSHFSCINRKSKFVLKETEISVCTCTSWPLHLCVDSYWLVNQSIFLITRFNYYTWNQFVKTTFSCIITSMGEEFLILLSILLVILFNKYIFMHADKHLKMIIKPGRGRHEEDRRTIQNRDDPVCVSSDCFLLCFFLQWLMQKVPIKTFWLMYQVIDSLTEVASGAVYLSMPHVNKLPQQNQEGDIALPCGLPVKLHVLFCCTDRQPGLYLGPSALLKEFLWRSEVVISLHLLARLGMWELSDSADRPQWDGKQETPSGTGGEKNVWEGIMEESSQSGAWYHFSTDWREPRVCDGWSHGSRLSPLALRLKEPLSLSSVLVFCLGKQVSSAPGLTHALSMCWTFSLP